MTVENGCSKSALITKNPEEIVKSGEFNNLPIMMGYMADEGYLFAKMNPVKPDFIDDRDLIPKDINIDLNSNEAVDLGKRIEEFYYGNTTQSYENIDPYIDVSTKIFHDMQCVFK